jgi:hypothetical protein
MTDPYVPASGVTYGAIAGSIVAAAALKSVRPRPSPRGACESDVGPDGLGLVHQAR